MPLEGHRMTSAHGLREWALSFRRAGPRAPLAWLQTPRAPFPLRVCAPREQACRASLRHGGVLRAQAADARADHHRTLLEIAGRKEVLMLIPLVFLILPTVVLVALFPAMTALTSVSP